MSHKQVLISTPCGRNPRPPGAGGSRLRKQKEVVCCTVKKQSHFQNGIYKQIGVAVI